MKHKQHSQAGFAIVHILGVLLVLALVVIAFLLVRSRQPNTTNTATTTQTTDTTATKTATTTTEDLTKLPIGDGNVSTAAKKGYVYSCQQDFSARAAGAEHSGPWMSGNTWDLTAKPAVPGEVSWPNAKITISTSGNYRIIDGNGLPVGMTTGTFPIPTNSTAYTYDRNPNTISAQQDYYKLPLNPTPASKPGCVPMGVIGYMTNGVALYNALDAAGRDAAAHEVQDSCDGHPEKTGEYHYHSLSRCVEASEGDAKVIGYALDGYPITGNKDIAGNVLTTSSLDACHGTTSAIMQNGQEVDVYHYVLTHDYPYSVGCYMGTSVRAR